MHERSPRSEGALAPCTLAMLVGVLPKGASFVGQMLASPMLGGLANSLNLPTAAVAAVWSQAGVERTLLAYDDAMLPRLQDLPRSLLEAVATSILSCGAAGCWRRKGSLAERDAGRPARDAGGRERRDECPRHLPTPLALLQGNGRSARVGGHDQGCSWGLFCGGCSKGPGPSFGAVLARFGAGEGVTRPWGTRGMPARPSPGPMSMGRVWG